MVTLFFTSTKLLVNKNFDLSGENNCLYFNYNWLSYLQKKYLTVTASHNCNFLLSFDLYKTDWIVLYVYLFYYIKNTNVVFQRNQARLALIIIGKSLMAVIT